LGSWLPHLPRSGRRRFDCAVRRWHEAPTAGGYWTGERPSAEYKELLDEATALLISGEAETARVILRDLVNATLGFEQLAKLTDVPSKSLHRMLSRKGNPSMDNLAAILSAVSSKLPRVTRNARQRKVA
jgi:DNA-binding phage protein